MTKRTPIFITGIIMKKYTVLFVLLGALGSASTLQASPEIPGQTIFPEEFKVYYKSDVGVSRKVFHQSQEKTIPTKNIYKENPGCYLSCVTDNKNEGQYVFWDQKYIVGQLRVKGHYANGICMPHQYENKDIRNAKEFTTQCENVFPEKCSNSSCKVNGHTANWFF